MTEDALARLIDRQAVVDVVVQYATGLDRRDWDALRGVLHRPVRVRLLGLAGPGRRSS